MVSEDCDTKHSRGSVVFLQFSNDMSRSQMKFEIIVEIDFFSGIKHEAVLPSYYNHISLAYQESMCFLTIQQMS